MQKLQNRRIQEIDALRGIAAIVVLLSHYLGLYDFQHHLSNPLDYVCEFGAYGVHLFFIISGFVILMTLQNCRGGLDFVVSRFSRIFPAYWTAVIITSGILFLFLPASAPSLAQFAVNFTMLQRFLGFFHIDEIYWTLNVEMSFYLWMLLLFKCGGLPKIEKVIPLVLIFQLAMALYTRFTGHMFPQGLKVVLLLEYAHLFCAGMLFFRIWEHGFNRPRILLLVWCFLNQTAVWFRDFQWVPAPIWGDLAVALIFLVMVFVVRGKMSWLVHPTLLFLGTISYTLYLLHHMIGTAVMENFARRGYSRAFGFAAAFIMVMSLATLVSFVVEKPAMKSIRQRYKAWKARHHPAGNPPAHAVAEK